MPYDERLASRIRAAIGSLRNLEERKMFGGVGFLINGNMACGVHQNSLIVRVGPASYELALSQPHTCPFDITGRPMNGWVRIGPQGCASEDDLKTWIEQGLAFALSLPSK